MNAPQLLFKPREMADGEGGTLVETNPAAAGWDYLSFSMRRLVKGDIWTGSTGPEARATRRPRW